MAMDSFNWETIIRTEVIALDKREKKKDKKKGQLFEDNDGVAAVQNQLNESYQSGVIEDQLHNNKAIHTFNNRKN